MPSSCAALRGFAVLLLALGRVSVGQQVTQSPMLSASSCNGLEQVRLGAGESHVVGRDSHGNNEACTWVVACEQAGALPRVAFSSFNTETRYDWVSLFSGYDRHARSCVNGRNIRKITGQSIAECEALCDADATCVGFEYGVAYGGSSGTYNPRDCQLQSGTDMSGCNGAAYNLDFYTPRQLARCSGQNFVNSAYCQVTSLVGSTSRVSLQFTSDYSVYAGRYFRATVDCPHCDLDSTYTLVESASCYFSQNSDYRYFISSSTATTVDRCSSACCAASDCTGFEVPSSLAYCALWLSSGSGGGCSSANSLGYHTS
eukprot:SAG22_NODE_4390_length_1284_cov_1.985654_1_plen_314_part_10